MYAMNLILITLIIPYPHWYLFYKKRRTVLVQIYLYTKILLMVTLHLEEKISSNTTGDYILRGAFGKNPPGCNYPTF